MTAQEQQMLQGLVDRINRTPVTDRDVDAEQLIQRTLGQNPDALYVMAQTVLVQGYALQQAQRQIVDLRTQLDQARAASQAPQHTSFLGNLLGRHDEPRPAAAAPPPPPPVQAAYPAPGYGPGLTYPSGGYPIAGAPPAGGGFLMSAMQTATGVAAGALAFEGIESLMHGFGHAAGYGSEFGGIGGGRPEEVINNYYGDAGPNEHGGEGSRGEERREDGAQFGNASDTNDGAKFQDASYGPNETGNDGESSDDLSGTSDTDYSSQGDDSMLADNVEDGGGDFGGGDSNSF
jgi:uncharacterized protein